MNTNFEEKMLEAANDLVEITNDSIRMTNCTFEETFPATTFKLVEADGQKFQMKVEVSVRLIED